MVSKLICWMMVGYIYIYAMFWMDIDMLKWSSHVNKCKYDSWYEIQVWFMTRNASMIYMLWISRMTCYEYQVWYDTNIKHDMLQELSCTSIMMHDALDLKRGCQLMILGIAPIMELTDGLLKRVSIPNLWLLNMLDRRSNETGQYPWTHEKGTYVGQIWLIMNPDRRSIETGQYYDIQTVQSGPMY